MPQIKVPKEKLKGGFPDLPPGTYTFRFDGFEPELSKKKDSVNLWPKLTVVNHSDLNGRFVPAGAMNSQAGWEHIDFVHSLGEDMATDDGQDFAIPGLKTTASPNGTETFQADDADPDNVEKWKYNGPLLGKTGKVEVVTVPHYDAAKAAAGTTQSKILKYYCAFPGCTHEHRESLI